MSLKKIMRGRSNFLSPATNTPRSATVFEPANPGQGLFTPAEWEAIGCILGFSDREREVTILLLQGLSRTEIAASLRKRNGSRLSAQTVRVYIDRIFHKAHVQDRLELALRLTRICRQIAVSADSQPHG